MKKAMKIAACAALAFASVNVPAAQANDEEDPNSCANYSRSDWQWWFLACYVQQAPNDP